jgi:hypothetical protein
MQDIENNIHRAPQAAPFLNDSLLATTPEEI